MSDVDHLELGLRRLPATSFVAVSQGANSVTVQVKTRPGMAGSALRRQIDELCRSHLSDPFVVDYLDGDRPARVALVQVAAEAQHGAVAVALALQDERRTGRAEGSGPDAAARATCDALEGLLGTEVPFRCEAAATFEHAVGEGVMVVLTSDELGPRYGVAGGTDPLTAGARATLAALNRFLADPVVTSG
jgi:hypothetical protein